MNRKNFHSRIYFWSLVLLVISMPLSHFLMSIATLMLAGNWILEGQFKDKWSRLRVNKGLYIFLIFYLLFLIGLIYTSNFAYAFKDLKIKLPLFALPLIVGTTDLLTNKRTKNILLFFVAAVIAGTIISAVVYYEKFGTEISDTRGISLFISHIRFSLQIVLSIFILINYYIYEYRQTAKWEKIVYPLSIIWLGVFLLLLKTLTGLVILFIVSLIIGFVYARRIKHLVLKLFLVVILITIPLLGVSYITKSIAKFYTVDIIDAGKLEKFTPNRNSYHHSINSTLKENGHFVDLYLCEPEMRTEWNKRSSIEYDSIDLRGHGIKYTLMRYLTSLNMTKDSLGVWSLSDEDVHYIEAGMTNYIYKKRFSLYPKIYEIVWQIDRFKQTGDPSGSSINQRLEYLKAGREIIKSHFWLGVGTGDVNDAFMAQYKKDGSLLEPKFRRRAHNQYMTFFITLGVIGFILCMVTFIYPFVFARAYNNFLALVFLLIALLSMINEDTLENHAGVTFIAIFYALFIFGIKHKRDITEKRDEGK